MKKMNMNLGKLSSCLALAALAVLPQTLDASEKQIEDAIPQFNAADVTAVRGGGATVTPTMSTVRSKAIQLAKKK